MQWSSVQASGLHAALGFRSHVVRKVLVTASKLTRSDTEVAISSIMMSSSVVPGIRMDAKYSVIFGEQHLAKTDTSCIRLILETRP